MNPNFLIFLIIGFITISSGDQTTPICEGSTLNIKNVYWPDLQSIVCEKGAIVGKSFEQIIREVKGSEGQRYNGSIEYPFDEVAHNFTIIGFNSFKDNLTIGENSLSHFPNLKLLYLESHNNDSTNPIYLDIHPSAFERTKKLSSLLLQGVILTDNTLRALENTKDQLTSVKFENLLPGEKIYDVASKFTNLTAISFLDICGQGHQPDIRLEKTSESLKYIAVTGCDIPVFTSNIFSKFTNLMKITWGNNNTTRIEPGTLDRFENLREFSLGGNNLRELPDGLFSKNKKLRKIYLKQRDGNRLNVSPANFTHCDETPRLYIDE